MCQVTASITKYSVKGRRVLITLNRSSPQLECTAHLNQVNMSLLVKLAEQYITLFKHPVPKINFTSGLYIA